MYFVRGQKIARGGGNISSGGEEIFPPPGDFIMGETLFRDTGQPNLCASPTEDNLLPQISAKAV